MMLTLSEAAVAALAVAAIASDNDQGILLAVPQAGAERSEGMEAIGIVQC